MRTYRAPIRAFASQVGRVAAIAFAAGSVCSLPALGQPLQPAPEKPPQVPARSAEPPAGPLDIDAAMMPYESRPIRAVQINGLNETPRELVQNQVRTRAGAALSVQLVRDDVQRLNRLGRFRGIRVEAQPFDDGSVSVVFDLLETPVIRDVEAVGNRQIPDADLGGVINILKDTPVDEFQIGAAKAAIERLYRDKGYYQATVTIDQKELDEKNILLFRISEGERVRVTDIRFQGNTSFPPRQLMPSVQTKTAGLFESGPLDNEVLDRDVAELISFYKDRGYLDIRADRQITFAPNAKEAIVTFLLDEGRVYTLRSVKVAVMDAAGRPIRVRAPEPQPAPEVFSPEQIAGLMTIKAGDVYSADKIRKSLDAVRNAYARMGFVDVRVDKAELRDEARPEVDLLVMVREGDPFLTGLITIAGNELTQKKVIMRELENLRPGRPLDVSQKRIGDRQVLEAEDKLRSSRLFEPGSVKITVQPEDPRNPGERDVLVEVKETNTGSLGFGAGVSSDGGIVGNITLTQRNFDWQDTPDSWGEFITGRAFRGGGQDFTIALQPGTEQQNYGISLRDPYVFDSDYEAGINANYRIREYDEFNEDRFATGLSLGRRFGERWSGALSLRYNNVDISEIEDEENAAADLLDVKGAHDLTGLGFRLERTTVDSRLRPSRGAKVTLGAERIGVLGGDYDFTKLAAEHIVFFTVDEDFLGRKTILSLRTRVDYIPEGQDSAPLFERYYLGGRDFRGFRFRTISPKGLTRDGRETDDPVGGSFSFFFGPQIEKPVFKDIVSVVGFIDSGTADSDVTLENYRVSAGIGLRLYIEAIGPVPIAFDFGFPILKQYGDEERVFSFSFDLPF